MEIFMNGMDWFMAHGVYRVFLIAGLAMILIGLFRAFGLRLAQMGKSAVAALWLISLVVLLICIAPVFKASGYIAQSIPFVGGLMDYGSIITLIEKDPWAALVSFVDCYLLTVISGVIGGFFSGSRNIVSKVVSSIVVMLVCLLALEWIKSQEMYQKLEKLIYALSGGVLVFGVAGLIAVMRWGGGVLPPIMSLMPDFLVGPLYTTAYYVMFIAILEVSGMDLVTLAQNLVAIGTAFAPAALIIAALGVVLLGALK